MSQTNTDVTLRFVEAMGSNDPQAAAECLAEDCMVHTKGFSRFSGTRPGSLVIDTIESFKMLFPTGLRLEIKSVIDGGDRVVVEAEGNAMTGEDQPYSNQYCFVATLKDGKIVNFNEYLCTQYAEEVLGGFVERTGSLKIEDA